MIPVSVARRLCPQFFFGVVGEGVGVGRNHGGGGAPSFRQAAAENPVGRRGLSVPHFFCDFLGVAHTNITLSAV